MTVAEQVCVSVPGGAGLHTGFYWVRAASAVLWEVCRCNSREIRGSQSRGSRYGFRPKACPRPVKGMKITSPSSRLTAQSREKGGMISLCLLAVPEVAVKHTCARSGSGLVLTTLSRPSPRRLVKNAGQAVISSSFSGAAPPPMRPAGASPGNRSK